MIAFIFAAFFGLVVVGANTPTVEEKYGNDCAKKAREYASTKPVFTGMTPDYVLEYAEKNCTKLSK